MDENLAKMNIQIKKFSELTTKELYQVLKLRVDVFVVEQNCPYPELDDKDQGAIHFYILEDEIVKSYLRVYFISENRSAIGRVVTHAEYRNVGLGRELMKAALHYLNGKTASIYLQAQVHLESFYGSFGFETISESYLEDGIPHVDMELLRKGD